MPAGFRNVLQGNAKFKSLFKKGDLSRFTNKGGIKALEERIANGTADLTDGGWYASLQENKEALDYARQYGDDVLGDIIPGSKAANSSHRLDNLAKKLKDPKLDPTEKLRIEEALSRTIPSKTDVASNPAFKKYYDSQSSTMRTKMDKSISNPEGYWNTDLYKSDKLLQDALGNKGFYNPNEYLLPRTNSNAFKPTSMQQVRNIAAPFVPSSLVAKEANAFQRLKNPLVRSAHSNEEQLKYGGDISQMGYIDDSPYRNEPFIDIDTQGKGLIDMSNTGIDIDANGVKLKAYSGVTKVPVDKDGKVRETPINNSKKLKNGGNFPINNTKIPLKDNDMKKKKANKRSKFTYAQFMKTPAGTKFAGGGYLDYNPETNGTMEGNDPYGNPLSSGTAGGAIQTMGKINKGVGMANTVMGGINNAINNDDPEQYIEKYVDVAQDTIASVIPVAGIIHGASEGVQGLATSIGGEDAGDWTRRILEPHTMITEDWLGAENKKNNRGTMTSAAYGGNIYQNSDPNGLQTIDLEEVKVTAPKPSKMIPNPNYDKQKKIRQGWQTGYRNDDIFTKQLNAEELKAYNASPAHSVEPYVGFDATEVWTDPNNPGQSYPYYDNPNRMIPAPIVNVPTPPVPTTPHMLDANTGAILDPNQYPPGEGQIGNRQYPQYVDQANAKRYYSPEGTTKREQAAASLAARKAQLEGMTQEEINISRKENNGQVPFPNQNRYGGNFSQGGLMDDPILTGGELFNENNFVKSRRKTDGTVVQKEINENRFNRIQNRYDNQIGSSNGEGINSDYTTVNGNGNKSVSGIRTAPAPEQQGLFSGNFEFPSFGGGSGGGGVPSFIEYGGKMENGGLIPGNPGSVPTTEFNAGGSHDESPLGGIPQGMNPNGKPNLVEEGELKIIDPRDDESFIISPKIRLTKDAVKEYGLDKRYIGKDMVKVFNSLLRRDSRRTGDSIEEHSKELEIGPYIDAHKELSEKKNAEEDAKKQVAFDTEMAKMQEAFPERMEQLLASQQQEQAPQEQGQPSEEEMMMMQQQMQQEQQMQQQMQQGAPQGGMPQQGGQPSPEEMAMMQQQGGQGQPPMMAYGGNINKYEDGGNLKSNSDSPNSCPTGYYWSSIKNECVSKEELKQIYHDMGYTDRNAKSGVYEYHPEKLKEGYDNSGNVSGGVFDRTIRHPNITHNSRMQKAYQDLLKSDPGFMEEMGESIYHVGSQAVGGFKSMFGLNDEQKANGGNMYQNGGDDELNFSPENGPYFDDSKYIPSEDEGKNFISSKDWEEQKGKEDEYWENASMFERSLIDPFRYKEEITWRPTRNKLIPPVDPNWQMPDELRPLPPSSELQNKANGGNMYAYGDYLPNTYLQDNGFNSELWKSRSYEGDYSLSEFDNTDGASTKKDEMLVNTPKTYSSEQTLGNQLGQLAPMAANLAMGLFGKEDKLELDRATKVNFDKLNNRDEIARIGMAGNRASKGLEGNANASNYLIGKQALFNSEANAIAGSYDRIDKKNAAIENQEKLTNMRLELENLNKDTTEKQYSKAVKAAKSAQLMRAIDGLAEYMDTQQRNDIALQYANMGVPDYRFEYSTPYERYLEDQKNKKAKKAKKNKA